MVVFSTMLFKNSIPIINTSMNRFRFIRQCHNIIKSTPDLDFSYFCDPSNTAEIKNNIKRRKGVGNIDEVIKLYNDLLSCSDKTAKYSIKSKLLQSAMKIPNKSHPEINNLGVEPLLVRTIGEDRLPTFECKQFHDISNRLNICQTENLTNFCGPRSYYFLDDLALLEQALIKYTLLHLNKLNFQLISVPDILPQSVVEYCGMDTRGERNQVYILEDKSDGVLCLSGTAEMGIAYYLSQKAFKPSDLPLRIVSVSRCFRAETSKISEEKGIYRVHQFTKVEMFGVCQPSFSDILLQEFVSIQEDIFNSLELILRVIDMPPAELGAQAARKYDIEAWLPGKNTWGEISSASNCTDYQSRRLGIKSENMYLHTINGTACAVPRLIIALLETHQKSDGNVKLPAVLAPYLETRTLRPNSGPKLYPFKPKERFM